MLALFVAYVLLNLGRAIRTNYYTSQRIHDLKQQIASMTTQTLFLKNELVYYKSRSYQELEAKRRLGLKRPGEIVVLVPTNTDPASATGPQSITIPLATTSHDQPVSFFEQASINAGTWASWLVTPFRE